MFPARCKELRHCWVVKEKYGKKYNLKFSTRTHKNTHKDEREVPAGVETRKTRNHVFWTYITDQACSAKGAHEILHTKMKFLGETLLIYFIKLSFIWSMSIIESPYNVYFAHLITGELHFTFLPFTFNLIDTHELPLGVPNASEMSWSSTTKAMDSVIKNYFQQLQLWFLLN